MVVLFATATLAAFLGRDHRELSPSAFRELVPQIADLDQGDR
jgi:hypothetical protein